MSSSQRLKAWGIEPSYEDFAGEKRDVPEETLAKVLELVSGGRDLPPEPTTMVVQRGERLQIEPDASIVLESGEEVPSSSCDLPLGYHRLITRDGDERRLIVSPGSCFWPDGYRVWGWALQLYALRSTRSWGMGDLHDLRTFGEWAASVGASTALINPLHAVNPGLPQQASPYYPGSRCFRNPLYLCIEEITGADGSLDDLEHLAAAGRSLNGESRVDRDAVYRLKMRALELLWTRVRPDEGFDEYVASSGRALVDFATFMTIAEQLGNPWTEWPAEYARPDASGAERIRRDKADRVRFHCWLQWLMDVQLEEASQDIDIVHDLAIGVDPTGVDAWVWQDQLASGCSVGAPPDDYNAEGQDWGVRAFHPQRLAEAGYDPLIKMIRSAMRHAGGMRFDHVMGLFRLYWIPEGSSAKDGAYVRYPAKGMLDVLALESYRAQAFVVGEDLGTVETQVREEMTARNMLSYKLVWFEDDPPSSYPSCSFAAPNTHDLPSTAGLWTGADIELVSGIGHDPNQPFLEQIIERLCDLTGLDRSASTTELVRKTYELLAKGSSAIVVASLDDALEVTGRYNIPGTTGDWNWTFTLPLLLEELLAQRRVRELAEVMEAARPRGDRADD